jgi:hypothetical protein
MPQPPLHLIPETDRDTFAVLDWKAFRPGYHKGRLWTRAECEQIAANFQRLSAGDDPHLKPKAKLGHNAKQRIAESQGWANVGTITRCEFDPTDGGLILDVTGIPAKVMLPNAQSGEPEVFDLKGEFDRGGFNDGSVEIEHGLPDPADPSQTLPGPVITGVAFLGEEQPAVKGLPAPKATFSAKPQPCGQLRRQQFRQLPDGRRVSVVRVVFSEVDPMPTREEILAKLNECDIDVADPSLANKTDEELFGMLKMLQDDGFQMALKKKFAATPEPEPKPEPKPDLDKDGMAALAAKFSLFMDDCTKRMGAMEQAVSDIQKLKPDVQAAAKFSQDYGKLREDAKRKLVTDAVDRAVKDGKLMPADREDKIVAGMGKDNATQFSDGANKGKTALEVWVQELEARKASFMFSETINDTGRNADGTKPKPPLSDLAKKMLSKSALGRQALAQLEKQ